MTVVLMIYDVFHIYSYVGRLFVKGIGKPIEILGKLNEMAGYDPDQEIELYEVCSLNICRCNVHSFIALNQLKKQEGFVELC